VSHTYHAALAGYDARNVFHDGCPECERRAADFGAAIANADANNFRALWMTAAQLFWFERAGFPPIDPDRRVSECDHEVARQLYTVMVVLERHFGLHPRGMYELAGRL